MLARHSRFLFAVVAMAATMTGLVAPLAARADTAPEFDLVQLGFRPRAFNDGVTVVGTRGSAAIRWTASGEVVLSDTANAASENTAGDVLGWIGSDLVRWGADGVSHVLLAATNAQIEAGAIDASGSATYLTQAYESGRDVLRTFNAAGVVVATDEGRVSNVRRSSDGAITYWVGPNGADDPTLTRWLAPAGSSNATLPSNVRPVAAGPGKVLVVTASGSLSLLDMAKNAAATDVPLPSSLRSFDAQTLAAINSKGRILAEVEDGDLVGASESTGGYRGLYTYAPTSGWANITSSARPADATDLLPRAVAVNEWGDMLVAYDKLEGEDAAIQTDSGAVLRRPRTALTGRLQTTTVASGRAAKRASVTVRGGGVELRMTPRANGSFSVDVPGGSYELVASSGACIVTKGGCASTIGVSVGERAATIQVAKKATPVGASIANASGASIRLGRGAAPIKVACARGARCTGRIVLTSGRTVIGSANVTVAAGRTKAIRVPVNAAGKTLLQRRSPLVAAATLTAKAGTARTSAIQRIQLLR